MRYCCASAAGGDQGRDAPTPAEAKAELKRGLRRATWIILGFIVLIWLIEFVNALFLGGRLTRLGIEPRTVTGLRGILFMPLLHAGVAHLFSNSIGLLLLGGMTVLREERDFWVVRWWGRWCAGRGPGSSAAAPCTSARAA